MLNNDEVNAVVIAVPDELHYQLAKKTLLSDKNVFCEKPLSFRVEERKELVELAQKTKKF